MFDNKENIPVSHTVTGLDKHDWSKQPWEEWMMAGNCGVGSCYFCCCGGRARVCVRVRVCVCVCACVCARTVPGAAEHEYFALPPEAVLQQVRELGVAVGDVLLLARDRTDDVAQRGQRLVDGLGLRQPRALHP